MLRNNKIPKTSGCSSVWLERYLGVVEAVGSSPVTPTKHLQSFLCRCFFIIQEKEGQKCV